MAELGLMKYRTGLLFLSLRTFYENTITPAIHYGIVWHLLICHYLTSYLQLLAYALFQIVDNLWHFEIFNKFYAWEKSAKKIHGDENSVFFVLFILHWKIQ